MSLTGWTYYARISRSLVLSVKNNVYIEQARLGGASNWKILLHYIIPNVLPSLLVNIFQDIGGELLTISGLSLSDSDRRLRRRSGALCFQKERITCIPLRGCLFFRAWSF